MAHTSGPSAPRSFTGKLWYVHWPVVLVAGMIAGIGCAAL
jgi:hypothetical protein